MRVVDVVGYEGLYKICEDGTVYSSHVSNRAVKNGIKIPGLVAAGYHQVQLTDRNKCRKMHYVHRLVASHFIPNNGNKDKINHINGIKTDNHVENLEWCTQM